MYRRTTARIVNSLTVTLVTVCLLPTATAFADSPVTRMTIFGPVTTTSESGTPAWLQLADDFGGPELVGGYLLLVAVALIASFVRSSVLRRLGLIIVSAWCALQCYVLGSAALETGYRGFQLAALAAAVALGASLVHMLVRWSSRRVAQTPRISAAGLAAAPHSPVASAM